jgi:hypothetical protein
VVWRFRRQGTASRAWKPSGLPDWVTEKVHREQIQPNLATVTVSAIASALGVSKPYATDVRRGKWGAAPRHWRTLAHLAEVLQDS